MKENEKNSPREELLEHFEKALTGKKAITENDIKDALDTFYKEHPTWAGTGALTTELKEKQLKGLSMFCNMFLPELLKGGLSTVLEGNPPKPGLISTIGSNIPASITNTRIVLFPQGNETDIGMAYDRTVDKTPEKYREVLKNIHPVLLAVPGETEALLKDAENPSYPKEKFEERAREIAKKELKRVVDYIQSPWGQIYAAEGQTQKDIMGKLSSLEKDLQELNKKSTKFKPNEVEEFSKLGLNLDRISGLGKNRPTEKEKKKVITEKYKKKPLPEKSTKKIENNTKKVITEKYKKKPLPEKSTKKIENNTNNKKPNKPLPKLPDGNTVKTENNEKPFERPVPKYVREQNNKEPVKPTRTPPKLPENKQVSVKSKETPVYTPRPLLKKLPTKDVIGKHTEKVAKILPPGDNHSLNK